MPLPAWSSRNFRRLSSGSRSTSLYTTGVRRGGMRTLELQVRADNRVQHHGWAAQRQRFDDVIADGRAGGRRQGHDRHAGAQPPHERQPPVRGAEIVAPLRHAVCLVDDKEGKTAAAMQARHQAVVRLGTMSSGYSEAGNNHQAVGNNVIRLPRGKRTAEVLGIDLLRGDIQQLACWLGAAQVLLDGCPRRPRRGRVDRLRRNAATMEVVDLVFDQREQRADDNGHARETQRGQLVAKRLPSGGRHGDVDILARLNTRGDGALLRGAAEAIKSEHRSKLGQQFRPPPAARDCHVQEPVRSC
eukprot:m.151536 g.151536  ORF g.151536 m.151536 type:complete len:301 (-) comp9760_c3_seq3:15-917(-)